MAKLTRSHVRATVASILRERTRKGRQKVAMEFTRDLLGDQCTDVKFTMSQLLKIWHKVGLPRR
jgi:hypothetical protein